MGRRTPAPQSGSFGGPAGADSAVMTPHIAKQIATHLHLGQYDKAGQHYYLHVAAVGDMVRLLGGTEEEIVAGYFHDSVEDEKTTIEALRDMGTSEVSLAIIDALTKRKGESNHASLDRVVDGGRGSCLVKFADLLHNTRVDRVAVLREQAAGDEEALARIDSRLRVYQRWIQTVMVELDLLNPMVGHG
jgi:(p)ppGpp synthase/HD superfamily hydrolase